MASCSNFSRITSLASAYVDVALTWVRAWPHRDGCSFVYAMKGEGQASQFMLPLTSSSGPGIGGQIRRFGFRFGR